MTQRRHSPRQARLLRRVGQERAVRRAGVASASVVWICSAMSRAENQRRPPRPSEPLACFQAMRIPIGAPPNGRRRASLAPRLSIFGSTAEQTAPFSTATCAANRFAASEAAVPAVWTCSGWRRAFSLLEAMIVLAVIGLLLAVAIPRSEPTLVEQLRATSRIVAAELQYARSLAVSNNSMYRVAFDPSANELILTHSGTKAELNTLPTSAFHSSHDTATSRRLRLDDLPNLSVPVKLIGATVGTSALQSAAMVEFGPMGQTTASAPTTIWLAVTLGNQWRYATITVNPITGLVTAGGITAGPLPGVLSNGG